MNKNDLKYDPELPYVVVEPAPGGIKVCGRFVQESDARHFLTEILGPGGDMIDTTPKPKIPADAKHITWGTGETAYSRRGDVWVGGGRTLTYEDILDFIGDSEVVVLVPKGDA